MCHAKTIFEFLNFENSLSRVLLTVGKEAFGECFSRQSPSLPSVKNKTLGKENFKLNFEALNEFKSKRF